MANYDEHTCYTCGQIFKYCRRCVINPIKYKEEGFCSQKCSDIFAILSKHGCNLIDAEEVLTELDAYNIDEIKLTEDIVSHIERIKSEVDVAAVKVEPVATVKQSNKNNKKEVVDDAAQEQFEIKEYLSWYSLFFYAKKEK